MADIAFDYTRDTFGDFHLKPVEKAGGGEGSKGGHVVGHTKSGKPIYGTGHEAHTGRHPAMQARMPEGTRGLAQAHLDHMNKHHPDYTKADHQDAANHHTQQATHHQNQAIKYAQEGSQDLAIAHSQKAYEHNQAAQSHSWGASLDDRAGGGVTYELDENNPKNPANQKPEKGKAKPKSAAKKKVAKALDAEGAAIIEKAGEGSRGGSVVGHTTSGKPIYASNSKRYAVNPKHDSPTHDFHDDGYTRADHLDAAKHHNTAAEKEPDRASRLKHRQAGMHHSALLEGEVPGQRSVDKPKAKQMGRDDHWAKAEEHQRAAQKMKEDMVKPGGKFDKEAHDHHIKMSEHHIAEGDKLHKMGQDKSMRGKAIDGGVALRNRMRESRMKKSVSFSDVVKAGGEGSRGGKVVGHTRSGKAIYDKGHYQALHTGQVKTGGAKNNIKVHNQHFPGWTSGDHEDALDFHRRRRSEATNNADREHHARAAETHTWANGVVSSPQFKTHKKRKDINRKLADHAYDAHMDAWHESGPHRGHTQENMSDYANTVARAYGDAAEKHTGSKKARRAAEDAAYGAAVEHWQNRSDDARRSAHSQTRSTEVSSDVFNAIHSKVKGAIKKHI